MSKNESEILMKTMSTWNFGMDTLPEFQDKKN